MNTNRQITKLASLAALMLVATPALAESSPDGLRWDCQREGAPRYQEIATAFGYENVTRARAAQPTLYRTLRSACQHGADVVLVRLQRADESAPATFVAAMDDERH